MPTTHLVRPLDFEVNNQGKPEHYGAYYWAIGLPDGREIFLLADRVDVVASGTLVAWQTTSLVEATDGEDRQREPMDEPKATMILAPGTWTHCYAASVFDGCPVAVDHLAAPTRRAG